MTEFSIPEQFQPTQEYLELAAAALRADGADIIGTPIVDCYLHNDSSPMLRLKFMDEKLGIVYTAIPIPRQGSGEV